MVTGAILFFSGVASMILGPLTSKIVNPNGIIPDTAPEVAKNVPWLFQFLAMYFAAWTIVCTIIQPPLYTIPTEKGAKSTNSKTNDLKEPLKVVSVDDKPGFEIEETENMPEMNIIRKAQIDEGVKEAVNTEGMQILGALKDEQVKNLVEQHELRIAYSKKLSDIGEHSGNQSINGSISKRISEKLHSKRMSSNI